MAQRWNDRGDQLGQLDHDWRIADVTDGGVMIRNLATEHTHTLFRDQVHHYSSDNPIAGALRGFLTLNVQLYLIGAEIQIEPTRPGEELDGPPPRRRQASLIKRAMKVQDKLKREQLSKSFRDAPTSLAEADHEFASLHDHFQAATNRLQAVMPDFRPDVIYRQNLGLLRIVVLEYSMLLHWQRQGLTLTDSVLRISYWKGLAPIPVMTQLPHLFEDDEPLHLWDDDYTYDLTHDGEHRWVKIRDIEPSAHTSAALIEVMLHTIFDMRE